MAYVDDVRNSFDVAQFCATVSSGVGVGRTTAEYALRDKSSVSLATKALEKFLEFATRREPPDVIAAYVQYSPGGSEIFTALRAVPDNKAITAVALDCLTAIVRYSLEPSHPVQALEGARSIVKDVVKTRASLINDIFLHDKAICAQKALILLRLVASCHSMLAKELMNRINLAANHIASALCSVTNNRCRVPFLDLLFVLLACGDRDILFALATHAREVLINALKVVTERTLAQILRLPAYLGLEEGVKLVRKGTPPPSHVQKKELIAAINMLLAIERHLLSISIRDVRRTAFAYPMLHCLAELAAAELPPLTVAPAIVMPDHEAMRKTARRIFIAIASDTYVCPPSATVSALQGIKFQTGRVALGFLIHVLESLPKLCKQYLEDAYYILNYPSLSSTWLASAAIISTCVLRLNRPVQRFVEKEFFERCLQSKDSLIMQTGVVILRAYCKVIANNAESRRAPERFLPKIGIVDKLVLFHGHIDEVMKLRSDYDRIFSSRFPSVKVGSIRDALRAARNDPLRAEFVIREGIRFGRRNTFETIIQTGHLAQCIIAARESTDRKYSKRLWHLCKDVIASSELFPPGSEPEIEIFLAFLSTDDDSMNRYTEAFIDVLTRAWRKPYLCFDEICNSDFQSPTDDNVSVVSAAIVQDLRQRNVVNGLSKRDEREYRFHQFLVKIVRTVAAFQGLLGYGAGGSYLRRVLPQVLEPHEIWWESGSQNHTEDEVVIGNCRIIEELFSLPLKYPQTSLLQFVKVLSIFQLRATTEKSSPVFENHVSNDHGRLWSSWSKLQREGIWTEELSILQNLRCSASERGEYASLILGRFHQSLHRHDSQAGMTQCCHDFEKMMPEVEYILSIAAVLRVTKDQSVRSFLVSEALDIRRKGLQLKENSRTLTSIIEDSLIHGIVSQEAWDISQVDKMITFVLQVLIPKEGSTPDCDQVSFCFSLAVRLLQHQDPETRILSAIFLSKAENTSLPDLRKFSLVSTTHIAVVLDACPALWRFFSRNLQTWTAEQISSHLPALLPVLRAMLCTEHPNDGTRKPDFEKANVTSVLLDALAMKNEALLSQSSQDDEVIPDTMGKIGMIMLRTKESAAAVLHHLRSVYDPGSDFAFQNIILLLLEAFGDWNTKALETQFPDRALIQIITMIVHWFVQNGVDLAKIAHACVLRILMDLLKQLRVRRVTLYDLIEDSASFEKNLTSLCSKLCSSVSRAMQCNQAAHGNITDKSRYDSQNYSSDVLLMLQTVTEVLSLDLLLDKAAKRSILSLCENEGNLTNFFYHTSETSEMTLNIQIALCGLVSAAIKMLPRLGIERDAAIALSIVEGVLSSPVTGFSASLCPRDLAIRECMDFIAQFLKLNQARSAQELPEKRQGFFNPVKSNVLVLFEKGRLLSTCTELLRKPQHAQAKEMPKRNRPFHNQRGKAFPYDPIFVLRTFLVACAEALKAPSIALMDIGRVSKDGLLSVAITGIASEDEHVKSLSYACLHSFSDFVGPISGVPIESAAALYIHRRQLSFLLTLLKNSISAPRTNVAPIFAVWFRTCLKEALSPSHKTYGVITYFLLRAPTLDVTDCVGIQYLLYCDEFRSPSEREATRLLALEILRMGTWSLQDFNILRKRRLLDDFVELGPNALGDGSRISIEVFKVFSALLSRDDGLLSFRFINRNELVPWILPPPNPIEEEVDMVFCRLQLLRRLALCIPRTPWSKQLLPRFSVPLHRVGKALVHVRAQDDKLRLVENLIDCYGAFMQLDIHRRRSIESDVVQICHESDLFRKSACVQPQLARVIARQKNNLVDVKHYLYLLRSSLPNDASGLRGVSNMNTLNRADALEVCMAHAFVADGLLFRQSWKIDNVVESKLLAVLAQAMHACPTVWLTMACFSALQTRGYLGDELAQHANRIPGKIPAKIYPDKEMQFCSVVDSVRPTVIEKLMSCARDLSSGMVQRKERREDVMSGLVDGLPQRFSQGVW